MLNTGPNTFDWFKRKDRPPAESDRLGPYHFPAQNPVQVIEPTLPLFRRLITLLSGTPDSWQHWKDRGNITLDLLSWLWEGIVLDHESELGVADFIDEEFRMHRYYQRLMGGSEYR